MDRNVSYKLPEVETSISDPPAPPCTTPHLGQRRCARVPLYARNTAKGYAAGGYIFDDQLEGSDAASSRLLAAADRRPAPPTPAVDWYPEGPSHRQPGTTAA